MITIRVTPDDLVNMRFAYHPLLEIPLSYRVLINPAFQSPFHRWVDDTRRALFDTQLPYLSALVEDHGYIPDFLTPTPISNRIDIEADFADLLATPDDMIRQDVLSLIEAKGDSEMRRFFVAHPREALACLVEETRLYWRRTLAESWSRMISVLEGDVLYRGRLLALDGPGPLFENLHPSVGYRNRTIHLQPACDHIDNDVDLGLQGTGIQLVPVIFPGCGRMYQVTPDWKPMLAYGVRGAGMWEPKPPSKSLELALGAGRASVLQGLRTPATTGEMAHKLNLTSGAVSQQLDRLKRAGLVESHRSGKRVYYRLTRRGEDLLALFERMN